MEIKDWLDQIATNKPELEEFLTSINDCFTDSSFNLIELQRIINIKLDEIDEEFIKSFKVEEDAENKES